MAIIFNGKHFASKKEEELVKKVKTLRTKGVVPKLETILSGNNKGSQLYVKLKKAAGDRIGAEVNVYKISYRKRDQNLFITQLIKSLNKDESVHGIMVQLPLQDNIRQYTKEILSTIASEKDVDGQRDKSPYLPATAKAVLSIVEEAKRAVGINKPNNETSVVVYGAKGNVGKPLVRNLRKLGYKVITNDVSRGIKPTKLEGADILISATGRPNLIRGSMVKEGSLVIDVGSPKGDVAFNEVVGKASFITPVPGGVGPVTVVSLLENLVEAASKA